MVIKKEVFKPGNKLWRINNVRVEDNKPLSKDVYKRQVIPCRELFEKTSDKEEFGNSIYFGCETPYSSLGTIDTSSSVFDYLEIYGYLMEIEFYQFVNYVFYDAVPPDVGTPEWHSFISDIEICIGKKYESPFMNWLGKYKFAFKCVDYSASEDTQKRYEIIIPHSLLLAPKIFHQKNLGFWKRNVDNSIVSTPVPMGE